MRGVDVEISTHHPVYRAKCGYITNRKR